jgi:hypothetical protein
MGEVKNVPLASAGVASSAGTAAKYAKLGKGACRGSNWQNGDWPKDKGRRTEKECYAGCLSTSG